MHYPQWHQCLLHVAGQNYVGKVISSATEAILNYNEKTRCDAANIVKCDTTVDNRLANLTIQIKHHFFGLALGKRK